MTTNETTERRTDAEPRDPSDPALAEEPPATLAAMEIFLDRLIRRSLHEARATTGTSVTTLAARLEMPRADLAEALAGDEPIGAAMLHLLCGAMRVSSPEILDHLPDLATLGCRYA